MNNHCFIIIIALFPLIAVLLLYTYASLYHYASCRAIDMRAADQADLSVETNISLLFFWEMSEWGGSSVSDAFRDDV